MKKMKKMFKRVTSTIMAAVVSLSALTAVCIPAIADDTADDWTLVGKHTFENNDTKHNVQYKLCDTNTAKFMTEEGNTYYLFDKSNPTNKDNSAAQWIIEPNTTGGLRDTYGPTYDKFKIEFDVKYTLDAGTDGEAAIFFAPLHKYREGALGILCVNKNTTAFGTWDGGQADANFMKNGMESGKWYHYTYVLDKVNKTGSAVLEDKTAGTKYIKENIDLEGKYAGQWTQKTTDMYNTSKCALSVLAFFCKNASFGIDNLEIYAMKESLSVKSAEMISSREVEISFSHAIDADKAGEIVVLDKDNNNVEYTGKLSEDRMRYTITIGELQGGDYIVKVPVTVTAGNRNLKEEYTYTITIDTQDDSDVIAKYDFAKGLVDGNAFKRGGTMTNPIQIKNENDNYFLHIPVGAWEKSDQWIAPSMAEGIKNDWEGGNKYNISFDIRQNTAGKARIYLSNMHKYTGGVNIFSFGKDNIVGFGEEGGNAETRLMNAGDFETGKWYRYSFTLNVDKKTAYAEITDGEAKWSVPETSIAKESSGWWRENTETPLNVLAFLSPGADFDIDNVEIRKEIVPLSVENSNLTLDGKFTVEFNYAVNTETAGAIKVMASDGTEVLGAYEFSEDGKQYVYTPSKALTPGNYIITVGTDIRSRNGKALEAEYTKTVKVEDTEAKKIIGIHRFDGGKDNGKDLNFGGQGGKKISIVQENGNYYLSAPVNDWNVVQWLATDTVGAMRNSWLNKKYKIEFDVRYNPSLNEDGTVADDGYAMIYFSKIHKYNAGVNIFSIKNGNVGFCDEGGNSTKRLISGNGLIPGEWYHYTYIIDNVKKTASAQLTKGEEKWTVPETSIASSYQGWWKDDLETPFTNLAFLTVRAGLDIDNVVFAKEYDKPKAQASDIKFFAGNEEQKEWTAVSSLTNKIEIDFGTDMNTETLTENIYVTLNGSNEKLASSGSFEGETYTLTLNNMLKQNTEYTLHIGSNVANAINETLDENVEFDFRTGEGCLKAELKGIKSNDGNDITSFSDFGGNMKINVQYANSTGEEQKVYIIVAQYTASNSMADIDLIEVKNADTIEEIPVDYNAVCADGAVRADIMLWDSLGNMTPLSTSITLN